MVRRHSGDDNCSAGAPGHTQWGERGAGGHVRLSAILYLVYISLFSALLRRLNPPPSHSGLQHTVENWKEPDQNGPYKFEWTDDLSRDIIPKACHSHNDYWRHVPLYAAFRSRLRQCGSGHLADPIQLATSHSWLTTTQRRTLRSLYLDPLAFMLSARNVTPASASPKETGLFDANPNTSVILLIDFKSDGHSTWPALLSHLQPLCERDWPTYHNGTALHRGALTVVGTGNAPFDLVLQNATNRLIFFDAPLLEIADEQYDTTNSYYASVQMKSAVGRMWFDRLSVEQDDRLEQQIRAAEMKGLKSRYWGEPHWPISLRNRVWRKLMDLGVGMLNVDDLVSAARWNWDWYVVAGLVLCGND
ncbi:Altered inheritance of mitochondria protein 6 [Didymella keratinophila]|nr:Altered inheritance of mitochondria protein 6 [Didymella keratinophila]